MCSAIFANGFLARTTDRQGSLREHSITATASYLGGTIVVPRNHTIRSIWIDGINRCGLMIALLNYQKECACGEERYEKIQLHPGNLIPAVLENCASVKEAGEFLTKVSLTTDVPEMYPHYILADKSGACIVFENKRILDASIGVLTNAPSFAEQMRALTTTEPSTPAIPWNATSESRFRRLVWLKRHVPTPQNATELMNLLDSVAVQNGADSRNGYRTLVRSIMNAQEGSYSFCTEQDRSIITIRIGRTGKFSLL